MEIQELERADISLKIILAWIFVESRIMAQNLIQPNSIITMDKPY